MIEWLTENWQKVVFPALTFLATCTAGLWLRRLVANVLARWVARTKWGGGRLVAKAVHRAFVYWFILLGIYIALQVSVLSAGTKSLSAKVIGTLFVMSLGWAIIVLVEHLIRLYLPRTKVPHPVTTLATNAARITVIVAGVIAVLDIWGVPTTSLMLVILAAVLVALLAFRNAATNISAGLQLGSTQQIKTGDYIKLESGEEGYVTEISWSNTRIKSLDESTVIVPNSRLLQQTVINYGRPLKKAKDPFRFYSRTHITELTGLKARNLREMADILRQVPDAVVYFHTHHFLEEQYYLTPQLSNDFAVWVTDALADEVLGEKLASIDTFSFPNLGALRERIVATIEEHLAKESGFREAMPGREFHFMKSVSAILPTPYAIHDLREFAEALRRVSLGSLYFHVYEARLRLGRGLNDFSIWLRDSLDEAELSDKVARLDPYTYTLEGLRSALIQLIEKRVK